jgi:plastocyanin
MSVLAIFGVACSTALAQSGSIGGTVKLKGGQAAMTAPRQDLVPKMAAVKECAALHAKPTPTETEVVSKDGEVRYVLVSIKSGLGDKKFTAPAEPAKLDQEGCIYKPHVFGMMVGQKLQVSNNDPTLHNVNGQAEKNEAFNSPQPAKGTPIEKVFKRPETFFVKCDVHPWMGAWVGVFEHPFYAVTDKDGKFTIKDVPPGEYTLTFWHEVYPPKELKIKVDSGAEAKADMEMEPPK